MDARGSDVRPSLFARTTPDGQRWEFTATPGGGCALLRGGGVVTEADGTEASVDRLVGEFLLLTGAGSTARPHVLASSSSEGAVLPAEAGSGTNPRAA